MRHEKAWEEALSEFMKRWKGRKEVVGAIVCGSYVTGNPSKHSDVDVQILLNENVKWRERGNEIIKGILIEYFANPLPQNFKYYEENYNSRDRNNIHMFLTGKVLFDKNGDVKMMVDKAREWDKKKFKGMNRVRRELAKYHIWDMKDNLEEAFDKNSNEFFFVYYNCMYALFDKYSEFLRYSHMGADRVWRSLMSDKYRRKYKLVDFPDKTFAELYERAMILDDRRKMLKEYIDITNHVLDRMGGFEIDGWKVRSKAEKLK
jgi:predicted nucleotidyltransferase